MDCDAARAAYLAAERALTATLTPEQRKLWQDLDAAGGWMGVAEVDRFVAELARHFPAIAPAIRAVAYHVEEASAPEGTCCRGVVIHLGTDAPEGAHDGR